MSALKALRLDADKIVSDNTSKTNKIIVNLFKNKKSRKLTHVLNIRAMRKSNFLIPNIKKVFKYL